MSPARFAPGTGVTLLTLILCALFVRLGFWQWQRWEERDAAWKRFARGADTVQPLGASALEDVPLYQRVGVSGRLDGQHQFLLDNLSYGGRPGYQVLTPLERSGGGVLLIDRGWVPFTGARSKLPDVTVSDAAAVVLTGRVANLPVAGLASGRAPPNPLDPWPQITSFPRPSELARALGVPLGERILLLDPTAPEGYVRDWQPPGLSPFRHLSYAIQWWCFTALAVLAWAVVGLRRARPAAGLR